MFEPDLVSEDKANAVPVSVVVAAAVVVRGTRVVGWVIVSLKGSELEVSSRT